MITNEGVKTGKSKPTLGRAGFRKLQVKGVGMKRVLHGQKNRERQKKENPY